jgi:tripartite-type tricarboxylate transporter receptor subunit TctC
MVTSRMAAQPGLPRRQMKLGVHLSGRALMVKPLQTTVCRRMFARITFLLMVCISMLLPGESASAQTYPNGKPIRFVSGAAPGSASDVVGRAVGEAFRSVLGVPVISENRTGAAGVIAAKTILSAPPDGHTILVQTGSHTIAPFVVTVDYDPLRDFSGVAPLASVPNVLVVAASADSKTVEDLIVAAKAKPGHLNFASVGTGSATFMSAVKFNRAAGLAVVHVPFKGAVDAITETLTGRVDYFFAPLVSALPLIHDGKLRPLAVNTVKRVSQLPDVPTLAEAGVANADYLFWVGLLVSSRTPRDIVQKLNQVALLALQTADLRGRLVDLGAEPMSMGPAEFDALLRDESASAAEIFRSSEPKQ